MEDEDELKEYVIRQSGAIYVGSYRSPTPKQWYFGQVRIFHATGLFLYFVKISGKVWFLIFSGGIERDQKHEKI